MTISVFLVIGRRKILLLILPILRL